MVIKNGDFKATDEVKSTVQDEGWAWMVLLGAFISTVLTQVPLICFSILYRPLLSSFHASSSAISWLFNVHSFIWNIFSITLAPLCDTFGWRKVAITGAICNSATLILSAFVSRFELLFLVFSVFGGIGGSIGVGTNFIVVSNYFQKRRGFAIGLTTIGVCVSLFLGPLTVIFLQKEFSSRGTFLITGALLLNVIPSAMLFRPNRAYSKESTTIRKQNGYQCQSKLLYCEKRDELPNSNTKQYLQICSQPLEENCQHSCKQLIKMESISLIKTIFLETVKNFDYLSNKRIVLICIATPFLFLGYVNFQLWVPFAVVDYGYSIEFASFVLSSAGITNAVGRICACALADWSKINNLLVYNCGVLGIALSILMFASFKSVHSLIISVWIWGFSVGISMALYPVVLIEVVGVKTFPIAYGLGSLFAGFELLIFGPIIGFVKDACPNFQIPLTLMSGLVLIAFGSWLFMPMAQKYDERRLKLGALGLPNGGV